MTLLDDATEALEVVEQPKKQYDNTEVYKKWFKSASAAGFISVTPWWEAQKFAVDIGSIAPDTSAVKSSTKCFVDMVDLSVYLRSVINGSAETLFPKKRQCPSPESFLSYGGSGEVSRVFKVHYWGAAEAREGQAAKPGDPSGFAWKCGHFKGKVGPTGAIEPIFSEMISSNFIRMSRLEMLELSVRVDLALVHLAATAKHGVVDS